MAGETVFVAAPARLHFGFLDLRGALGRKFGGIGAASPAPSVLLSAAAAPHVDVEGEDSARAAEFARRFLAFHHVESGARIRIHRAIPPHAGLGSGTRLALAVGRALADLHALPADAMSIARAAGRAERSAVGMWTFDGGGLVLEGGRRTGREDPAPLLARFPFPAAWRCVVAIPAGKAGASGAAEAQAFATLPRPPEREAEQVSHLVLMSLLPALVEGDLDTFGRSLTEIQEINGRWFSHVQGGTFAPGPSAALVRCMRDWSGGTAGIGQSSWGPTVYAVVGSDDEARALATRLRELMGSAGTVHEGPFPNEGAKVWRSEG